MCFVMCLSFCFPHNWYWLNYDLILHFPQPVPKVPTPISIFPLRTLLRYVNESLQSYTVTVLIKTTLPQLEGMISKCSDPYVAAEKQATLFERMVLWKLLVLIYIFKPAELSAIAWVSIHILFSQYTNESDSVAKSLRVVSPQSFYKHST